MSAAHGVGGIQHLLASRRDVETTEAGILASSGEVTVAAQRWTYTSFHHYALASGLAGHLGDSVVDVLGQL
jgi:hypothetical protein